MTCCDIGYKRIGSCGNWPLKCIICYGPYKVKKYCYGIVGCNKRNRKICVYVTAKCANCGKNHITNFPFCVSKPKVFIKARKKKKIRERGKKKKCRQVMQETK